MSLLKTESDGEWPPTFDGGVLPAVALVLALSVWVVISNSLLVTLLGRDAAVVPTELLGIGSSLVQLTIVGAVLRYEGVDLEALGLSRRLLVPAVIGVVGVVAVFNGYVAARLLLAGEEVSVAFFAPFQVPDRDLSTAAILLSAFHYYLLVGPVEELAFRGYLQNKLVDLLGDRSRLRIAIGVVGAAVAFALLHVPTILVLGETGIGGAVGLLVFLTLSGITFGTIYALTRNLYLVAFLHGIGDFWPLFVEPGPVAWPNYLVLALVYAVLVVVYRQWASRTDGPTTAAVAAN